MNKNIQTITRNYYFRNLSTQEIERAIEGLNALLEAYKRHNVICTCSRIKESIKFSDPNNKYTQAVASVVKEFNGIGDKLILLEITSPKLDGDPALEGDELRKYLTITWKELPPPPTLWQSFCTIFRLGGANGSKK